MNRVQRYLFNRVLRSELIIVGGLTLLAILAQGLSQTDIIVENRQGALTFFKIVALGVPQIVALLTPMAMFVATIWAASSLVRPGQFTTPDANLTVFAREQQGQDLIGVQISERIGQPDARDYLAERGRFIEIDGLPAIVMFNGQIHQLDQNGALNILDFEQSTFDLTPFVKEDGKLILKASDRYQHELLFIDRSSYNERQNETEFLAEANSRLSSPLSSVAMALLAILAVVGGNFSRRGYARRIVIASSGALVLIIVQLSVQSSSGGDPMMNLGQWLVPFVAIGTLSYVLFRSGQRIKGAPKS